VEHVLANRRFIEPGPDDPETTSTGRHVIAVERPFVIVLESPFVPSLGTMIPIDRAISIGRSGDADVTIMDPALSRRHVELACGESGCTVRDLGSRNGTRVNGVEIAEVALWPGDQIQIGATLLQFHDSSAATHSDTWLRKALTSNAVALWEYCATARELVFSEHTDRTLDLPVGTLGGRRLAVDHCVHTDDRTRLHDAAGAVRGGVALELELRLQPSPAVERWVMLRCHAPASGPTIAGTLVDITSVKRREATLSRTALIFESFLDGVTLTDERGAIVDLNTAMARHFECERTGAIGKPLASIVKVSGAAEWVREAATGIASAGRWVHTLQTGPQAWFDLLAFPLRTEYGENAGTVWVFRDVSERQRMTAQIAFLDRLASLGTLSAGVAHEINNPLTFILGNAEIVREALSPGEQDWMIQALDEIVEGSQRIAAIVRDLRAFSRAESDPVPKATEVKRAVEAAVKMTTGVVRARARMTVAVERVPLVRAVESRVVQVLVNLIVNAAQAMPEGDAGAISVRASRSGAGVAIDVVDTGRGMPAEVKARAFDPFFTTKPLVGTGLGLSICHGLVTAMGGTIALSDTPGGGTTVTIWLPAAEAEHPVEDVTRSNRSSGERLRVLVIDDEPAVLRTTARVLMEHDVVTADGFERAIDLLVARREAFDVVLCDLMMPDGSGMDLHARLTADRPDLIPHIVFVTGGALTPRAEEFLRTTAKRQLLKPVDRMQLRSAVREAKTAEP
jgi:PAS domain S-box-containing protein